MAPPIPGMTWMRHKEDIIYFSHYSICAVISFHSREGTARCHLWWFIGVIKIILSLFPTFTCGASSDVFKSQKYEGFVEINTDVPVLLHCELPFIIATGNDEDGKWLSIQKTRLCCQSSELYGTHSRNYHGCGLMKDTFSIFVFIFLWA